MGKEYKVTDVERILDAKLGGTFNFDTNIIAEHLRLESEDDIENLYQVRKGGVEPNAIVEQAIREFFTTRPDSFEVTFTVYQVPKGSQVHGQGA